MNTYIESYDKHIYVHLKTDYDEINTIQDSGHDKSLVTLNIIYIYI